MIAPPIFVDVWSMAILLCQYVQHYIIVNTNTCIKKVNSPFIYYNKSTHNMKPHPHHPGYQGTVVEAGVAVSVEWFSFLGRGSSIFGGSIGPAWVAKVLQ